MKLDSRCTSIFASIIVIAGIAVAQTRARSSKPSVPTPTLASTAGPLDLDVVVSAAKGKPVTGLHQQDFRVYLNQKPQAITGFKSTVANASAPVEIILLIDTVNTRFSSVAYERLQIEHFLKRNNGKLAHPITLAVLTDTGVKIMPRPSSDGNKLASFLNQTTIGLRDVGHSAGYWGWTEQFQISASALMNISISEQKRPGRKLLIWVSPGWPLLSGPEVELTGDNQQTYFRILVGLSAAMRKGRVTLYSVDPLGTADAISYRTDFYQEFTKGVRSPRNMRIGDLGLQVLALHSGGRVFNASNDVAREIGEAASDADNFYTIQIDSPPTDHANDYRAISVQVDKPGLTARTRTSYYAQP